MQNISLIYDKSFDFQVSKELQFKKKISIILSEIELFRKRNKLPKLFFKNKQQVYENLKTKTNVSVFLEKAQLINATFRDGSHKFLKINRSKLQTPQEKIEFVLGSFKDEYIIQEIDDPLFKNDVINILMDKQVQRIYFFKKNKKKYGTLKIEKNISLNDKINLLHSYFPTEEGYTLFFSTTELNDNDSVNVEVTSQKQIFLKYPDFIDISGPTGYTKMLYKGMVLHIFGEHHARKAQCSPYGHPYVHEIIKNTLASNGDGDPTIHVFLEQDFLNKSNTMEQKDTRILVRKGMLNKVTEPILDCLGYVPTRSACPYKNVRVHMVDIRKRLPNFLLNDWSDPILKSEIDKIIHNPHESEFYTRVFNQLRHMGHYEKEYIKKELNKMTQGGYNLYQDNLLYIVDLFLVARILRQYKDDNLQQYSTIQHAIVYVGNTHRKILEETMLELGAKILYKTHDCYQCVTIPVVWNEGNPCLDFKTVSDGIRDCPQSIAISTKRTEKTRLMPAKSLFITPTNVRQKT
jgi:hypothetical protein